MKILLITFLFFNFTKVFALYEDDSRKDLYSIKDPKIIEISKSIANQLDKNQLKGWTFKKYWTVVTKEFGQRGICANERFTLQPSIRPECTAVLVGPKQLLTAGNCLTEHYCWNDLYYWVFGYNFKNQSPFSGKLPRKNFFQCEKILKRVFDPRTAISFTLIELKKEVTGRAPVKLSSKSQISSEDELITFGHESGLPLKISFGGKVYDQNDKHFLVNSDITGETNGAAIFNRRTLELEGLLIHGTKNYDYKDERCRNLITLENNEARELAIKASYIRSLLSLE